ncbi:hypothetical protein ACT8ZV_13720 [Nocardioides sp. MAHUQ-72]|uniref:hypothetical protein n=1 Tax=unclassified Nocardioides TaxID=2615069 RepID=UPI0036192E8A
MDDDPEDLEQLLIAQDGLITRRQLKACGQAPHDLERLLRRRELSPVHTGVYVNHTGPLTSRQRGWAAVLHAGRSALFLDSAEDPPGDGPVHLAIDANRRVSEVDGVRIHRVRGLEKKVDWHRSPPRVRVEENALELAHRAGSELDAIGILTRAVGSRRTTAPRLRRALAGRSRIRRRGLLAALLDDLEQGTCSVLEHGYLTRVQRPHGLPEGTRQRRRTPDGRVEYRDVEYEVQGLDVELDGRVGHAAWDAQAGTPTGTSTTTRRAASRSGCAGRRSSAPRAGPRTVSAGSSAAVGGPGR